MSQIEARILQQDYVLTCPEGQEDMLQAAVQRVDADMERIRNAGKVRARERVGVLAAVNLAFESASLYSRIQELELTAKSAADFINTPSETPLTAPDTDTALVTAELQAMLTLREHELLQAQALIARLEAALEMDSKLL